MVWNTNNNKELNLYHGTDLNSAEKILKNSINLQYCRKLTDFGQGFYTTTYLHQAKNWANLRCLRLSRKKNLSRPVAAILGLKISYNLLSTLKTLCFVTEGSSNQSDYWDLIRNCRTGKKHYQVSSSIDEYYDVIFGSVSLWPQTLVIKDCDQISFHTDASIKALNTVNILYSCTL